MPLLKKLVGHIGSGVGLASEALADHKEKKANKGREESTNPATNIESGPSSTSTSHPHHRSNVTAASRAHGHQGDDDDDDSSSISSSDLDNDKSQWALDEAAEELGHPPPSYREHSAAGPVSPDQLANAFLATHNVAPSPSQHLQPLPCPVIIPQRRPKDKSRGFVRAYAPLLGSCAGIDQQTFIDFLNDLDHASKASPVFAVVNMACFGVGFMPSPIAMAVTTSVQVASRAAEEVQTRHGRNTYLDQMNESLFKPRGLYCMIMTFKPDNPYEPVLGMDVTSADATSQAVVKATAIPDSELQHKLQNLRLSSGVTKGEISLPESAPLVYPALDAAAHSAVNSGGSSASLSEEKKNALSSSAGFLANYLDRRAQAEFQGSHPETKMAMPPAEKQFASRYADPNHPANSGTILGLLTGGNFDPKAKKAGRRAQRRAEKHGYQLSETDIHNAEMGRLERRPKRPGKRLLGRALAKDILYLTVVNLPTEAERREIMHQLDQLQNSGAAGYRRH